MFGSQAGAQTPAPVCDVLPLGVVYGATTQSDAWGDNCDSAHRTASGTTYYARYYSFSVSRASSVTIDLVSGTDTYLFLLQGSGKNGAKLAENDDIVVGNRNSRISDILDAGAYTIEATTYDAKAVGEFTLTITATASPPTPTATATPPATYTPTVTPTHTPTATPTRTNVSARLTPRPRRLPDDREWFEFELDTNTGGEIIVWLNRSISTDKIVGTKRKDYGIASCTSRGVSGQVGSNNFSATDGDDIYLAGCEEGDTTIELIWWDGTSYHFLRTYRVTVVDDDDYYDPDPTGYAHADHQPNACEWSDCHAYANRAPYTYLDPDNNICARLEHYCKDIE